MNKDVISISMETTKMGPIPSFSVIPGITCAEGCECFKRGCYAKSICARRKSVRDSWSKNYVIAQNTGLFVTQVNGWLSIYQPRAFRIHVGGDFFSTAYLNAWCVIAAMNPKVRFFAFTKQFDVLRTYLLHDKIPSNLSLILSAWLPGTNNWIPPIDLRKKFPVAWIRRGTDPLDSIIEQMKEARCGRYKYHACVGRCVECGMCFSRKRKDGDLLFEYH